jgi:hypothetical protein
VLPRDTREVGKTDRQFRETGERSQDLDERIDKLVSEISGFLRNKPR